MEVSRALAGAALGRAGVKATAHPRNGDARPSQALRGILNDRTEDDGEREVPLTTFTVGPDAELRVGDRVRFDNREIELTARLSTNALSQTWRGRDVQG